MSHTHVFLFKPSSTPSNHRTSLSLSSILSDLQLTICVPNYVIVPFNFLRKLSIMCSLFFTPRIFPVIHRCFSLLLDWNFIKVYAINFIVSYWNYSSMIVSLSIISDCFCITKLNGTFLIIRAYKL